MMVLLKIALNILIIGLFLYSKLLPYKHKLTDPYKKVFHFFDAVFTPALKGMGTVIKPFQLAPGLAIDMTQVLLLVLLLLVNNILR